MPSANKGKRRRPLTSWQKRKGRRKERESHLSTSCHPPRMNQRVNQRHKMDTAGHKLLPLECQFLDSFPLLPLQKCLPFRIHRPLHPLLRKLQELNVNTQVRSIHVIHKITMMSYLPIHQSQLLYAYVFIIRLFKLQFSRQRCFDCLEASHHSSRAMLKYWGSWRHEVTNPKNRLRSLRFSTFYHSRLRRTWHSWRPFWGTKGTKKPSYVYFTHLWVPIDSS